jgi:hypothetical protein
MLIFGPTDTFHLKTNIIIHKQIIDLLDKSDTREMSLTVCPSITNIATEINTES